MKKNSRCYMGIRMPARRVGVVGLVFVCAVSVIGQSLTADSVAFEQISLLKSGVTNSITRAAVVSQLKEIHRERRDEATIKARSRGLPLREWLPNQTLRELVGWGDGRPIYYTTLNANAAISTGANLLRLSPYAVDGSGWTVGVWDATGALTNHQELVGRATVKDFSFMDLHWHSTHVAGTIGASGVKANAMGMAPAVHIDSYDWNDDAAEMVSRGASYGGEPGAIYLSNHSYGMISGWFATGESPPKAQVGVVWERRDCICIRAVFRPIQRCCP